MYSDDVWAEISNSEPLANLGTEELLLLHRQWMWANQQKVWFLELLRDRDGELVPETILADRPGGAMVVFYGLLWSVLEGLAERDVVFVNPLRSDIERLSDPLRRCRNAVLHVPRAGEYFDRRIAELIEVPEVETLIRTVHSALGRLFIEAFQTRALASIQSRENPPPES